MECFSHWSGSVIYKFQSKFPSISIYLVFSRSVSSKAFTRFFFGFILGWRKSGVTVRKSCVLQTDSLRRQLYVRFFFFCFGFLGFNISVLACFNFLFSDSEWIMCVVELFLGHSFLESLLVSLTLTALVDPCILTGVCQNYDISQGRPKKKIVLWRWTHSCNLKS